MRVDRQPIRFMMLFAVLLTACSANVPLKTSAKLPQPIEIGTIIQIKKVLATKEADSLGSQVGISMGSGGYRGIYGSIDIGRVLSALNKPSQQLALIIKKQNGELIAINQPLNRHFKVGDKVKVVQRHGRMVVEY